MVLVQHGRDWIRVHGGALWDRVLPSWRSRKQRTGQKQGWAVTSMAYFQWDFHLPTLSYVLQVSQPPETWPPVRDSVSLWAIFHILTIAQFHRIGSWKCTGIYTFPHIYNNLVTILSGCTNTFIAFSGGLDENGPHRLRDFSTWSAGSGTLWKD